MIPIKEIREVKSSGVQSKGSFSISKTNQVFIMKILRDSLYSDKVMAVLRENSANALDAHVMSGKEELPIKVHIPTLEDPTLVIRDFGPGMSEEEMFELYTQYGESTKRGSNAAIGMLGIGSKSGFAYTDSFTITSWHGGTKSIYVAQLDESDAGEIVKISSTPCGEETGLEFRISVRLSDLQSFTTKAGQLYKYFEPRPDINIPLPPVDRYETEYGVIYPKTDTWIVRMGGIPYPLSISQLVDRSSKYWDSVFRIGGAVYCSIGEVSVSASRESIEYTDATKAVLSEKITRLIAAYIEKTLEVLDSPDVTNWEKRVRACVVRQDLRMPIPQKYATWAATSVSFPTTGQAGDYGTFRLYSGYGNLVGGVPVSSETKLYYQDTPENKIKGYRLGSASVVIVPKGRTGKNKKKKVIESFEKMCKENGCEGMGEPIPLSSLVWVNPGRSRRGQGSSRTTNRKHLVRTFRLKQDHGTYKPHSDHWEIVERAPDDNDVFVILYKFEVNENGSFYSTHRKDVALARYLGVPMPEVYGYKANSEGIAPGAAGQPYHKWREQFFKDSLTEAAIKNWENLWWSRLLSHVFYRREGTLRNIEENLRQRLGASHPLTLLITRAVQGDRAEDSMTGETLIANEHLEELLGEYKEPKLRMEKILDRYPLAKNLRDFWESLSEKGDRAAHWVDYIRLIDKKEE